ncbi:MAG: RluA family pseudouridine synthase [Candidatus Schekmanbacteria bacterium]|nr:RluA family pseudouridine synthase [Candidatus Schekmanbacteria bacterium]
MPKNYHFIVSENNTHQRLDLYLSRQTDLNLSRSRIQELIKQDEVKVNRKTVKANYSVRIHDQVDLILPDPVPLTVQAEEIPLEIVFEDEHLLVLNKPPGLVVHPGAGNREHTLVNALLAHCRNLSGIGGVLRPGIVHRLDKDTSGLMIVAKNDDAHQELTRLLAARKICRQYLAIVAGNFTRSGGTIDIPIGRHVHQRQKMSTKTGHGKEAVTHYTVREQFRATSLLLVKLDTGRTHQIRVHLSHIGHPVLGDMAYGRWGKLSLYAENKTKHEIALTRQMLHAAKLDFLHPIDGRPLSFEAPLPEDMRQLLEALRIDVCKER